MLLDAREKVGNRWSLIAKVLPGRSESHVKQRFNTIVTRIWRDATAFEEDERRHEATVAKSNRITPRPSLDDRREVDEQYFVAAANVKGLYDLRHQENDLFKRVEFSQREWEILEAKATRKAQDAPYEAASLAATATAALGHSFDHFQIPPREAICSPPPPLEIQQQQAQSSTSMESVEWNFFCDELCASPTNRLDLLSEDEIMADDAHPTFVSA